MRLAVKSVLAILALYVTVLAGIGIWLQYEFSSLATSLVRNTARLIANEIAGAVSGPAVDQLVAGKEADRERLAQIVARISEESDIVDSVAVVDKTGTVVAGDPPLLGRHLTPPQVIFAQKQRFELSSPTLLRGGDYHLFVPLTQGGENVGYLRLSIRSQRIVRLYAKTRRDLFFAAVLALLGAGLVGLAIHVQLTRRVNQLTEVLQGVSRGETTPIPAAQDEFANALDAARRVSRELHAAREGQSQATRRLGALLQAMDVGVILVKGDGSPDFANATACELLSSHSPEELAARWAEVEGPLLQPLREDPSRVCADGTRMDLEVSRQEGTRRLRFEVYAVDDEEVGFLVLVKDREMLENLERELGLAVQMRGLARFYGALAHDLRAPLNAMVMNIELLRQTVKKEEREEDGAAPERRERQLRYVGVLQQEVQRFDRQLKSLLSHAAPPSEEQNELDLREIVRDLSALLEPQARQQKVELTTDLPETPVTMLGQRDRLKQALLNVLINAIEAMPGGGTLGIDLAAGNGTAEIAVRDTGPGIEPELLGKIFEMSFTTKSGGTGVGLFVSRSIVESHGGRMQIESQTGSGTLFRICLPLQSPVNA
jgi:signal transduction histidine kinase